MMMYDDDVETQTIRQSDNHIHSHSLTGSSFGAEDGEFFQTFGENGVGFTNPTHASPVHTQTLHIVVLPFTNAA